MSTAGELTARIATLKKMRGSGVLSLRHGEEMTTFRSVEEINAAIAADERELAGISGQAKIVRRFNFVPCKGL
jgi:hypothetical protein